MLSDVDVDQFSIYYIVCIMDGTLVEICLALWADYDQYYGEEKQVVTLIRQIKKKII